MSRKETVILLVAIQMGISVWERLGLIVAVWVARIVVNFGFRLAWWADEPRQPEASR